MTAAVDDKGLQDRAADYDGEGQDWAARDDGDSGVVMMSLAKMAVAEDSGGGWQWRWRQTTATDNNGMQDWGADYVGEGLEWAANNKGIRH